MFITEPRKYTLQVGSESRNEKEMRTQVALEQRVDSRDPKMAGAWNPLGVSKSLYQRFDGFPPNNVLKPLLKFDGYEVYLIWADF